MVRIFLLAASLSLSAVSALAQDYRPCDRNYADKCTIAYAPDDDHRGSGRYSATPPYSENPTIPGDGVPQRSQGSGTRKNSFDDDHRGSGRFWDSDHVTCPEGTKYKNSGCQPI